MAYSVMFRPAARRELRDLEAPDQRRVFAAIEALSSNPRPVGCTKMAGFPDVWRIRVGVFRVIYRLVDRQLIVEVVRIGHRREVYRGL